MRGTNGTLPEIFLLMQPEFSEAETSALRTNSVELDLEAEAVNKHRPIINVAIFFMFFSQLHTV
jgi:hypothetical protein